MTKPTNEIHLMLAEHIIQQLRDVARTRSVPEEVVVEQALTLLFSIEDASVAHDYQFSIAAMRDDWDAMPEDWIADEVNHNECYLCRAQERGDRS